MSEFKDKIGAAAGKVEYLYDPATGRFATQITCSSPGKFAMYIVAVSLDGRHLLAEVPATGICVRPVQPEPSILTYIQSDKQGMWGRHALAQHSLPGWSQDRSEGDGPQQSSFPRLP